MTESDYAATCSAERAALLAEWADARRAPALEGPEAWWARAAGEIGGEA